jgi:hypothetical protein
MPPEIMWPEFDPCDSSCFLHDDPCSRVGDRKDPLFRLKRSLLDVCPQTLHHLSRDEDELRVLAALWTLDCQPLVADIFRSELEDFTDPHAASGHQFQDKPVSNLRPEDDLIDCLLFDNVPMDGFSWPVDFSQHRGITGVLNGGIKVRLDEIEEGFEVRVAAMLGLLLATLGDLVQESEDLLGCDGSEIGVCAKVLTELGEGGTVGLDRIFFQNSSCGTLCRLALPGRLS